MASNSLALSCVTMDRTYITCAKVYGILCRFAGSSVLDEDRASKQLEVDDQGLPRQASTDIWSTTSSRAPSRAASTTPLRAVSRLVVMQPVLHVPAGSRCSMT